MQFLRNLLDEMEPHFARGGRWQRLHALYEALDTFLYTPGQTAPGPTHVRDGIDMKRMMSIVVVALVPCIYMALWNTGLQIHLAMAQAGRPSVEGWRGGAMEALGLGFSPDSFLANLVHGALYFVPIYVVCMVVGGIWEVLFAAVRGHEVNEGFLVTGMLLPLTLPPAIPLWQVALGTTFGVVLGKEVFGGTGRNFLNPALVGRAFLFFAYPADISGDAVWVALDGYTHATPLTLVPTAGMEAMAAQVSWTQAFLGTIPGSLGETSALACLLGAVVLLLTGVGSWRIMLSMLLGAVGLSAVLYVIGSDTNPVFAMSPLWHVVLGGVAFGLVFMATDPVSAAMTQTGKWFYGLLVGMMTILIRVINPAFPEGVMLAILFGNVFAPVIDHFVVLSNIRRRTLRTAS
ncbi:MAG: NADH:ubiquinone reductase (Na(+)-transporting) subunit B [Candidatus Latescibacterota bacterium]